MGALIKVGSIIFIILGVWFLYDTYRNSVPDYKDHMAGNLSGFLAGLGLIILGFMLLFYEVEKGVPTIYLP